MTVYFLGILLYSWNHRTKIVWQRIWIFSRIKLSLKYADSDSLYIFIYFRIVVWVFRAIVIVHASDLYFITVTRIRRHDTHTIGDKGHWLSALRYICIFTYYRSGEYYILYRRHFRTSLRCPIHIVAISPHFSLSLGIRALFVSQFPALREAHDELLFMESSLVN